MEATQLQQNRKHRIASARAERMLLPHLPIELSDTKDADRAEVEHYIADCFYENYQAEISHFLPYLLSTHSDNRLTAAVGFQPAKADQTLFLEQYLKTTIESELSNLVGHSVNRNKIVEIGNLTSSSRGTSQILFILSVAISHKAGFEWCVFTATKQVNSILNKLNLNTYKVADADPSFLTDQGESWGSYYENNPKILAGNLSKAMILLEQHPVIGFVLQNYQNTITEIADRIKLKR